MKSLLRRLLHLHLHRARGLWILLAVLTLGLGWGILRVERRLDLMSLLPTDHPVVKASIQAGVGQQELLWLAAEGSESDLESREAWALGLVEKLMTEQGVPMNGLSGEGRLSGPMPVPDPKGASLWPPLLAAGSLLEGDAAVGRMLTEQGYALAPMLLGDRLGALMDEATLRRTLGETARDLASPDPVRARMAQLDPLRLRGLLSDSDRTAAKVTQSGRDFPLKLRTGYLVTKDSRFVLLPLMLDFPSGESASTAKVLAWLGRGAEGPLPGRTTLKDVERALAPGAATEGHPGRPFALQATGAHAIAYWESQRLGREVVLSLVLSFVLIGVVYWAGFRTLAGYGFVVVPLLVGMLWALGSVGWALGRINLMAAAFGAVLLGVGDDVGILLFSRYRDERRAGRSKSLALRAALMGTGPGVIAGTLATSLAFLGCTVAPFPGFRDLGFTAGIGLLACMLATFLLLPALLLALDKGTGTFAPMAEGDIHPPSPVRTWKAVTAGLVLLLMVVGGLRMTWEEDLRRFRQAGNPALALQESLGRVLGAGLQPLAIQIPLADPEHLPRRWNQLATLLKAEGLPVPVWAETSPEVRRILGSETWTREVLEEAAQVGLDPVALERPLAALRASVVDPAAVPRSLQALLAPPKVATPAKAWTVERLFRTPASPAPEEAPRLTLPVRLGEAAQDRLEPQVEAAGARLVGTRPLFRAIKTVAREALRDAILVALGSVVAVIALFGRRPRFVAYALLPLLAGVAGVVGILGWTGEPLTFLSLVAIPISLGVSVDVAMNLLHRARIEPGASARVARVNAVCAGTTLAGFGGLVFSGYRGLQGLGLAALGGTAIALLVTQWLLPWLLEKWPLRDR